MDNYKNVILIFIYNRQKPIDLIYTTSKNLAYILNFKNLNISRFSWCLKDRARWIMSRNAAVVKITL
jgi:hypothetical protein